MAVAVDCSYTDPNSTRHNLTCSGDNVYCCGNGSIQFCSPSECSANSSDSISTYAFWIILAGVAVLGVILLLVIYAICRYRNPGSVFRRKSVFGESLSEADRNSRPGSRRPSTRMNIPVFNTQTEHFQSSPRTTITVSSGTSAQRGTGSRPASRWTIRNGFNAREPISDRTDSKEDMIKSRTILPDVQG